MSIVNRRNAVLGWGIWKLSKPVLKSKAKSATPSVEGGRPNKSLVVASGAGVITALAFWRKRRGDDEG